jgi:hypothetical protein
VYCGFLGRTCPERVGWVRHPGALALARVRPPSGNQSFAFRHPFTPPLRPGIYTAGVHPTTRRGEEDSLTAALFASGGPLACDMVHTARRRPGGRGGGRTVSPAPAAGPFAAIRAIPARPLDARIHTEQIDRPIARAPPPQEQRELLVAPAPFAVSRGLKGAASACPWPRSARRGRGKANRPCAGRSAPEGARSAPRRPYMIGRQPCSNSRCSAGRLGPRAARGTANRWQRAARAAGVPACRRRRRPRRRGAGPRGRRRRRLGPAGRPAAAHGPGRPRAAGGGRRPAPRPRSPARAPRALLPCPRAQVDRRSLAPGARPTDPRAPTAAAAAAAAAHAAGRRPLFPGARRAGGGGATRAAAAAAPASAAAARRRRRRRRQRCCSQGDGSTLRLA